MARKRSVSGRKPQTFSKSYLTQKVEKSIKMLKNQKVYGKYASKKLVSLFKSENIKFKKGKVKIDWKKLRPIKEKKIIKVFTEFLKSKTSKLSGIKAKRDETRERLKDTLSGLADKRLDDDDIDDFYELVADDDFRYLADKIGDSEVYSIFQQAKEMPTEKRDDYIKSGLQDFMEITNSSDAYKKAKDLFSKYF